MQNCGTTGTLVSTNLESGTGSKFMFDATSTSSTSVIYPLTLSNLFNIKVYEIPDGVTIRVKALLLQSVLEQSGGCGCVMPRRTSSSEIVVERYLTCFDAGLDPCAFNLWVRGDGWYQFELWNGDVLYENNGGVLIGVGFSEFTPNVSDLKITYI